MSDWVQTIIYVTSQGVAYFSYFGLQRRRGKRQVQQRIVGLLIPYRDDPYYEIKQ
jgi:hypothetical protein